MQPAPPLWLGIHLVAFHCPFVMYSQFCYRNCEASHCTDFIVVLSLPLSKVQKPSSAFCSFRPQLMERASCTHVEGDSPSVAVLTTDSGECGQPVNWSAHHWLLSKCLKIKNSSPDLIQNIYDSVSITMYCRVYIDHPVHTLSSA
jgi:hypothetical protein